MGDGGDWQCPECQSMNAVDFRACWKCHWRRYERSGASELLLPIALVGVMAFIAIGAFFAGQLLASPAITPIPAVAIQSASPRPTVPANSPAPTLPPVVTPQVTATPTPQPTAPEDFLRAQVPATLLGSCHRSKGDENATNSVASLTCPLDNGTVRGVAFHLYGTRDEMQAQYSKRLSGNGVDPASGSCLFGRPGDGSWGYLSEAAARGRLGCFIDDKNEPNVRSTDESSLVYIAIVGYPAELDAATKILFDNRETGINYRRALAGFTAEGSTGEERAQRIRIAQLQADQELAQLDVQRQAALAAIASQGISQLIRWWSSETGAYRRAL